MGSKNCYLRPIRNDRRLKLEEERSDRINKLLQKYLDDKIDTETFERLLKLI